MENKLTHFIKNNVYYIIDDRGNELLKIKLNEGYYNSVTIETKDSVFEGPIEFLKIE